MKCSEVALFSFFFPLSFKDKACDAMEIFDELVESEVSIVTPHLKTLVEFCLQVCLTYLWMKFNISLRLHHLVEVDCVRLL